MVNRSGGGSDRAVVAIGLVIALLSAPKASAKGTNQFQLDIVIDTGKGGGVVIGEGEKIGQLDAASTAGPVQRVLTKGRYNTDSFFDISYVSNIGSSGLDGKTKASFNVDSFFDSKCETSGSNTRRPFLTDMIAMSFRVNLNDPPSPEVAIDPIRQAVRGAGVLFITVTSHCLNKGNSPYVTLNIRV